jgi:hypothetical protein
MALSLSTRYNKSKYVRSGDQDGHSVLSPNSFVDYDEVHQDRTSQYYESSVVTYLVIV